MATKEAIIEALGKLDAKLDDHWTADGSPRIDVVKTFLGEDVDRNTIILAAPTFNRKTAEAASPSSVGNETPPSPPEDPKEADDTDKSQSRSQNMDESIAELDPETKNAARAEAHAARQERMDRLEALNQREEEINAERKKIFGELHQIEAFLEKLDPPASTADTIQAYLAKSRETKLARAEEVQKLRQLAIDARSLSVKSPLDQAMAGKRRGS